MKASEFYRPNLERQVQTPAHTGAAKKRNYPMYMTSKSTKQGKRGETTNMSRVSTAGVTGPRASQNALSPLLRNATVENTKSNTYAQISSQL